MLLLVLLLQLPYRSSNPDRIPGSLHWLNIQERIETKLFPPRKFLLFSTPRYLLDLITVQPFRFTRSSTLVTVLQPPVHCSLKITNHTFWHAAPHRLWNNLPPTLHVPYQSGASSSPSSSSSSSESGQVVDISQRGFHSRLKTSLFSLHSHPFLAQADLLEL